MTQGIILAAGRGSRMQSHTDEKPKCLLQVQEKSLLEWQIDAFLKNGISSISIVCGYLQEKINHPKIHRKLLNSDWETTNMVYSLMQADEILEKDDCIISYSDIFYTPSCLKKLKECTDSFAITYDPHFEQLWSKRFENPLEDLETFELNDNQNLISIGKKPSSLDEIRGQYMGLIKISSSKWREVKNLLALDQVGLKKLDMTSLLNICLQKKIQIKAISIENDTWGEVDFVSDLNLYNQLTTHKQF